MAVQNSYPKTMPIGFPGMLDGAGPKIVETMRNDELTAQMPFGIAVKHASVSDEYSAKLLTAITGEFIAGIVLHQHNYASSDLGDDGVMPTALINTLRKGRMLVLCEDGCNVGQPLHVRAKGTGQAGALRASADGTDTINCAKNGTWRSAAAANGLAVLEFDFTNSPT